MGPGSCVLSVPCDLRNTEKIKSLTFSLGLIHSSLNQADKNIYLTFLTDVFGGLIETIYTETLCKQESIIRRQRILV